MPNENLVDFKYGNLQVKIKEPINSPTKKIFNSWKKEFLKIKETNLFKIYLVGSFNNNQDESGKDIDIILIGENKPKEIEKIIYEGTKLGFEKYNTWIDIMWFSEMPDYDFLWENKKVISVAVYILSPEMNINGRKSVNKHLQWKEQVRKNLWRTIAVYPLQKQIKRMEQGLSYKKPSPIN